MTSNQTVYFDNPASISQLQSLVCTTPYFNIPQTQTNLNKYLYGPVNPFTPSALPFLKCATGASTGQDALAKTSFTWAAYIGNGFTDEGIFYTTGACNSAGVPWDQENIVMPIASAAKFYNSFLWMKILDEQLISLSEPVSTYLPDWTGIYYYYTGYCTGAFGTSSTAPNWAAFTGARATGSLSEITIGQCISLNIGFTYWGTQYAPRGLLDAFVAPTTPNTPVEWAYLNSIKDGYFATRRGIDLANAGFTAIDGFNDPTAYWGGQAVIVSPNFPYTPGYDSRAYLTGTNSNDLANSLKLIKNGTVPFMYKVGDVAISPNSNIRQQRTTYAGLPYGLLAACCAVAVRRFGYASLLDYFYQKIATPLDLTASDVFFSNIQPTPVGKTKAEAIGRRTQDMCNTGNWIGFTADPSQYGAGLQYQSSSGATGYIFNSIYWESRFPKDGQIGASNFYNNDPLGWNFGANVRCNFKAWTRVIKLFINKGRYNGKQIVSRGMINWGMNNVSAPGAFYNQYNAIPFNGGPNTRWVACQAYNIVSGDDISDIAYVPSTYPGASRDLTINTVLSKNIYYWNGATGTQWIADLDTGFFCCAWHGCSTQLNNAKGISAIDPFRLIQQSL